jgi:transposase
LKSRLIFHWSDHRIIGHLMVCFLAYFCEAFVNKELRPNKEMMKSNSSLDKTNDSRSFGNWLSIVLVRQLTALAED